MHSGLACRHLFLFSRTRSEWAPAHFLMFSRTSSGLAFTHLLSISSACLRLARYQLRLRYFAALLALLCQLPDTSASLCGKASARLEFPCDQDVGCRGQGVSAPLPFILTFYFMAVVAYRWQNHEPDPSLPGRYSLTYASETQQLYP
jgi:hypothetical protein